MSCAMDCNSWTLILGASLNPARYSYKAIVRLSNCGYGVIAIGAKPGLVNNIPVLTGFPQLDDIHTVNLYLSAANQLAWYDYITDLRPRRVLFNPGTENPEFEVLLREKGINFFRDCTFVMLGNGTY